MNCAECGAVVPADAAYCTECGAALDDASTPTPDAERESEPTGQPTTEEAAAGQGADGTTQQERTRRATAESATTEPQTIDRATTERTAEETRASATTTDQTPPREPQQADSGWATTRMLAAGGGVLAGVSLYLPWVTAVQGSFSANGMATEFGTLVMAGAIAAVAGAVVTWGRGWGWLSMLFTGVAGLGVASAATLFQGIVSETATISFIEIHGNRVPIAAVEPATGVQVAIVAGALVALASLAGIVGSFTGS